MGIKLKLYPINKRGEKGFTLLEVIIVLAIVSVFILIHPPIYLDSIEHIEKQQFLETLQHDLLYLQTLSVSTDQYVRLRFYDNRYVLFSGTSPITVRPYPKDVKIEYWTRNTIEFNKNGTLLYPRTIKIQTKNESYHLVFPLGKGRGYIVQK